MKTETSCPPSAPAYSVSFHPEQLLLFTRTDKRRPLRHPSRPSRRLRCTPPPAAPPTSQRPPSVFLLTRRRLLLLRRCRSALQSTRPHLPLHLPSRSPLALQCILQHHRRPLKSQLTRLSTLQSHRPLQHQCLPLQRQCHPLQQAIARLTLPQAPTLRHTASRLAVRCLTTSLSARHLLPQ